MGRVAIRSTALFRRSLGLLVFALLPSAWAPSAWAQGPGPITTAASPLEPATVVSRAGPSDPAEVEAFFDDLIGSQLAELHIAGATVAVVRDGETLLLKGYGHADLENGVPVDPETTLFRIASVTKTFTATAVMQLVEQGTLDLDADVNDYLDFRIPATFEQPITLRHLLTHTPGFEDSFYDILVLDASDMAPVRDWLVRNMPARVWPPGQVAAYSNYGLGLAGYIVERASGQPFEEYVRQNILAPLGMNRTLYSYPFPADLAQAETKGYTYADGRLSPTPFFMGQPATGPAGGLVTTASDMTRFMIMHLHEGRYLTADGTQGSILHAETARLMHSTQYAADPRLLGTALGFFDFSDNGQLTIGHSGEAYPISSLMLLLPDLDVGIFVVYNSEGASDLTNQHLGFQRAVFDHYFPQPERVATATTTGSTVDSTRFAGRYRPTRGSYTTFEKVGVLFGTVGLTSSGNGTLTMETPWGEFFFGAVDPLFFRQAGGPFALSFREDANGRVTHMATDLTPMFAFERLRWFEAPGFNMALLAVCLVLLLSVVAAGVVRAVRRRGGSHGSQATVPPFASGPNTSGRVGSRRARLAGPVLLAVAVLDLLFVVGLMLWGNPMPLFGVSLGFLVVLGLGVLGAILTILALVGVVFAWKDGYWSAPTRVHYTVGTLAALGFVWFLNNWNLLGWRI